MSRWPTYRLYVDEVGNAAMTGDSSGPNRYLSLTGVIMHLGYPARTLAQAFDAIKQKHFPQANGSCVVFHRKGLVSFERPFRRMRSAQRRAAVFDELYDALRRTPFRLITVTIDKKRHHDEHGPMAWLPYEYCLAALLERFVMHVGRKDALGDVMVEARGPILDQGLEACFRRLCAQGTRLSSLDYFKHLSSRELKVSAKTANDVGLQLVDLVASPSDKYIKKRRGLAVAPNDWDRRIVPLLLADKYRRGPGRQLWGYGLKWL